MPVTPTYPGVYVEEVPSEVRTIVGVSTSVTAFVGFFAKGPMNKAVRALSFADFERNFGGLHRLSETSYAIQQYFANGGSSAWVVRVAAGSFSDARYTLQAATSANLANVHAGVKIGRESHTNPGTWGNSLRLEIDYETMAPASEFNLTVVQVASSTGRYVPLASETFRNLTWSAGPNNAIELINERSKLIQLHRSTYTSLDLPAATGTLGNPIPASTSIPPNGAQLFVEGNSLTLDYGSAPNEPKNLAELRPYLGAAIRSANPEDPILAGATVRLYQAEPGRFRFHVIGGRGGHSFLPSRRLHFADGVGPDGIAAADLGLDSPPGPQQFELAGGAEGDLPDGSALIGVQSGKSGIYALTDVDIFNILCIPRAAALPQAAMVSVVEAAQELCRLERAFLLVDIPEDVNNLSDMEAWITGTTLRHANAAIYFPRPRIADRLNGNRMRSIGASGTIAGLYARTDAERGVWKAPAGIDASLNGVQALDYVLTDTENGVLNPIGVNCLRQFDVFGNVAWGARTLDGADTQASQWKYIPVRRLALFLEESLYRGTQWVVFEPNDEPLWAQIRLNVGAFMNRLFRQGAFQGSTPREAYFVKCNNETTTQDDINNGIVNILVGFAPLKPAEFVIIRISQIAGDIPT